MVSVWAYGIRSKGTRGYFKHFTEPFPVLLPLNIPEELIKPITLALRLFGNIFAGGIMLALIGMIPIYAFWAPNILWKAFDMVIGAIQAFIFALLTVLYHAMAELATRSTGAPRGVPGGGAPQEGRGRGRTRGRGRPVPAH